MPYWVTFVNVNVYIQFQYKVCSYHNFTMFVYVSDLTKNVMYYWSYELRMNTKGTELSKIFTH